MSDELFSRDESNSLSILIRKMKLLLLLQRDNPLDRVREAQRILSFMESIFKSGTTGAVFLYLLDRGAATSWLLQVNLEIPEATAYQALRRLKTLGVITPETRISKQRYSKGGPRPIVWALLDANTEDIARAARDHQRAQSPNYRVAEEFVQYLLEDCVRDEITYQQILRKAKQKLTISTQRIRDVSELSATILKEKGIRVWR